MSFRIGARIHDIINYSEDYQSILKEKFIHYGVGVFPCMICGTNEIGEATAEEMKKFRLVVWINHGIYGAGETMDEAFGLIETVEKTVQI